MDTDNFDNSVPGTYEIYYFLQDSSGNNAEPKTKIITVLDTAILKAYPVYTGIIENEAKLPTPDKCFGGAWYHKVVSTEDYWIGMEGTVTIPSFNISRYKDNNGNEITDLESIFRTDIKNLDNPSIYMGGNAGSESDVGLSLSVGVDKYGKATGIKGSTVFRPFWRYITNVEKDEGSYDTKNDRYYAVSCTGSNCIANYHYSFTEYYYMPGDKLRMIIYSPKANYLQLQIEVLEVSTLPETVEYRKQMNYKDPQDFKSPIFRSNGHNNNMKAEFKRVNAIDQSGNEGKTAIDTFTEVNTAIWHESYLYRKIDGVTYRVPMTSKRVNVMNCPNPAAFIIEKTDEQDAVGGEKISIKPGVLLQNKAVVYRKKEEYDVI